jgi:hypothetical protein
MEQGSHIQLGNLDSSHPYLPFSFFDGSSFGDFPHYDPVQESFPSIDTVWKNGYFFFFSFLPHLLWQEKKQFRREKKDSFSYSSCYVYDGLIYVSILLSLGWLESERYEAL